MLANARSAHHRRGSSGRRARSFFPARSSLRDPRLLRALLQIEPVPLQTPVLLGDFHRDDYTAMPKKRTVPDGPKHAKFERLSSFGTITDTISLQRRRTYHLTLLSFLPPEH